MGSSIQNSSGGGQDGVILKLKPDLSGVIFSTFFGGAGSDACFVLAFDPLSADLFVAGATTSNNLPGDKTGVIHSNYQGGETDGFITRIKPDGSTILKTTYMGTTGNDMIYGIQFDKFGFPYIMGTTNGNWPVINAAFSNAGGKQFISKLKKDLSDFVYSTVFGTNSPIPNISPTAFLVDRCQNVYVSGWGGNFNSSEGYPSAGTTGMSVTPVTAIKSTTDGNDFYFFVLEKNAASQLYGSFFGQNGGLNDHVDGGTSRFDVNGIIYQAICANCGRNFHFPTTPGAWAQSNGSPNCNEALVKIEMDFSGIGASIRASINGVIDTIGCVPLTIQFADTLNKGKKYIWIYGDGKPNDTTYSPVNSVSHQFDFVGLYKVQVVSIDSATCNIADTAFVDVHVGNNIVVPKFIPNKLPPCTNLTYRFDNITTASLPNFTSNTFLWDFGDGSPKQRTGFVPVTHTYASVGIYMVILTVDDTTFCNEPATYTFPIRLAINVKAQAIIDSIVCLGEKLLLDGSVSLGGTGFTWLFGDGDSSHEIKPVHTYLNTGTYIIHLTVVDTSTCNKIDDTTYTVTVYPIPTADFSYQPIPPQQNKPIYFTNLSSGAIRYLWDFDDGETSTETNPSHLFNSTGTFNVKLTAYNSAGCSNTVSKNVAALILPLLDVPNAFTPAQFGENGSIKVYGFGIGKMDWKIYNRWGQVVFATTNRRQSWDGKFKGAIQPMDVYTYTLDVEFTDGKKTRKTGDITLLR